MTSKEFIKHVHDYFSFLEESGGPAMTVNEMHSWLEGLLDEYLKSGSDTIVDRVVEKFNDRSEAGIKKYGTTLASNSGPRQYWFNHLQEELMDATLYIERLKQFYHGED